MTIIITAAESSPPQPPAGLAMAAGGPQGGPVNGDMAREGEETAHHIVSDDMLFKLSKKIAQLTKVIYSLNTKNDDLEFDMENMRHGYEDKLEKVSSSVKSSNQRTIK